jgi:hypothetical protein
MVCLYFVLRGRDGDGKGGGEVTSTAFETKSGVNEIEIVQRVVSHLGGSREREGRQTA